MKKLLLVLLPLFIATSVRADDLGSSLIPASAAVTTGGWKELCRVVGYDWEKVKQPYIEFSDDEVQPIYFYLDDDVQLEANACTLSLKITLPKLSRAMTENEVAKEKPRWLGKAAIVSQADKVRDALFKGGILNQFDTNHYGGTSETVGGVKVSRDADADLANVTYLMPHLNELGPEILTVAVDRAKGKIQSVGVSTSNSFRRNISQTQNEPLPEGFQNQVFVDAWLLGKAIPVSTKGDHPAFIDPLDHKVRDLGEFKFSQIPSTFTMSQNGDHLGGNLYYPPILVEGAPMIYADYFPSFLINVTKQGDSIILKGTLPGKGKEANLKMGEAEAAVAGHKVALSNKVQVINGRTYLPYELLTLCNGIKSNWDFVEKQFSIDIRTLQRP